MPMPEEKRKNEPHAFNLKYINGNLIDLQPTKVLCVGLNYVNHVTELKRLFEGVPKNPALFIKPYTALFSLEENEIILPDFSKEPQHEIELAVLIGKKLKNATQEEVKNSILGYALAIDLTLRDIQTDLKKMGYPWEISKAFDYSCPITSFIPQKDIADPQNLNIKLSINKEIKQNSGTNLMIHKVLNVIEYTSKYFTLYPGDIILTGTPEGVGNLKKGDVLDLELTDLTSNSKYTFHTNVSL